MGACQSVSRISLLGHLSKVLMKSLTRTVPAAATTIVIGAVGVIQQEDTQIKVSRRFFIPTKIHPPTHPSLPSDRKTCLCVKESCFWGGLLRPVGSHSHVLYLPYPPLLTPTLLGDRIAPAIKGQSVRPKYMIILQLNNSADSSRAPYPYGYPNQTIIHQPQRITRPIYPQASYNQPPPYYPSNYSFSQSPYPGQVYPYSPRRPSFNLQPQAEYPAVGPLRRTRSESSLRELRRLNHTLDQLQAVGADISRSNSLQQARQLQYELNQQQPHHHHHHHHRRHSHSSRRRHSHSSHHTIPLTPIPLPVPQVQVNLRQHHHRHRHRSPHPSQSGTPRLHRRSFDAAVQRELRGLSTKATYGSAY